MDCQEDLENFRPLNHRWSYRKRLVDPLMDLQTGMDKTITTTHYMGLSQQSQETKRRRSLGQNRSSSYSSKSQKPPGWLLGLGSGIPKWSTERWGIRWQSSPWSGRHRIWNQEVPKGATNRPRRESLSLLKEERRGRWLSVKTGNWNAKVWVRTLILLHFGTQI